MKKIVISAVGITVVISVLSGLAKADNDPNSRLQALKDSYHNERQRVLKPVFLKYDSALQELITQYTKGGRLEGANATKLEMEQVRFEFDPANLTDYEIKKILVSKSWKHRDKKMTDIVFREDFTASWQNLEHNWGIIHQGKSRSIALFYKKGRFAFDLVEIGKSGREIMVSNQSGGKYYFD